jgi:hypothetical protein
MKRKITTLLLTMIVSLSFGQITLVKTLEYIVDFEDEYASLNAIELSSRERFAVVDDGHRKERCNAEGDCRGYYYSSSPKVVVYDNQFNELKSIIIDTTDIDEIYEIFVSDKIYNTDDKIELIYSYSKRYEGQSKREQGLIILDEDNNLLHSESDSDSSFSDNNGYYSSKDVNFQARPIVLGNSVYMLKEYVIQGSTIEPNFKTFFYKLGGELPCRYACNSNSTTNKSAELPSYNVNIYPNPTSSLLNIEIPMNLEVTKCEIYDGKGALLSSSFVNGGANNVDVSQLTTGTYVCTLYNDQEFVHSEVFIKK